MKNNIVLRAEKMSKSFGPTKALVNVDIEIKKGEIHGLIGENGSGKSTLSSICAGVQKADCGSMYLDGIEYKPDSTVGASNSGVSMVVQEQGTIGMITVAANIFVGMEQIFVKRGILNVKRMYQETQRMLDEIGVSHIKPDDMIDNLTFEDRKLIEIARALYTKPKLLIIDETTTALTVSGRDILYKLMKKMRNDGCSILFISHDIDEIISLCDSLTILRDGHVTAKLEKTEFESNKIKQLMIGREISDNYYRTDEDSIYGNQVVLHADHISYGILKNVSIELHKGEVLGIGGLCDCGMHDLGKILFGLIKPETGNVVTENKTKISNPTVAIDKGIAYVSKNRDKESMMPMGSIKDNICLPSLSKLKKFGLITRKKENNLVRKWVEELSIKTNSIHQYCTTLSGGNKQKVVLTKWLARDSEILILDCPTRGIDIGVKASIYKLLNELKANGKSILMISEELPELIGMSDRLVVLKNGSITGEFNRDAGLSESILIEKMI